MIEGALVVYLLLSLVLTASLIKFFIWCSQKANIFDFPDGILKVHKQPVSPFGGISIFSAVTLVFLFFIFFRLFRLNDIFLFLASTVPFLLLGFVDDILILTPKTKLLFQFIASVFFIFLNIKFIGSFYIFLLVLFFILSIINSFNLIDVSDGLLGFTILPYFALFFFGSLFSVFNLSLFLSVLSQILIGALVAFLCFNKEPAKIYMGDSGAFFIAATVLFFCFSSPIFFSKPSFILLLPILFGIPLAELFWLIFHRVSLGKSILLGSPHHFSMYLKQQGVSALFVAIFSGITSSILALGIFLVFLEFVNFFSFLLFVLFGFFFWSFLVYHPSQPVHKIKIFLNKF